MNIKVMMFFKATQKFFQSSWLAWESHKFLPIYTPFGEEAIWAEIQTGFASERRCSWVILASVSWSGDYGISLLSLTWSQKIRWPISFSSFCRITTLIAHHDSLKLNYLAIKSIVIFTLFLWDNWKCIELFLDYNFLWQWVSSEFANIYGFSSRKTAKIITP